MKKICLTILMTLSIVTGHAQITQLDTMKEVFEYFDDADSKTLAIFDVDMVLVQPSDPAFQMGNMKRFGHICKRTVKVLPFEKQMVFYSLMTISFNPVLVEECTPLLLKQLTDKGIPAMALTANLTGTLGTVQNMVQWRIGSLCNVGIDFDKNAPFPEPLTFDELASFRGNHSQYKNGVLCVNGTVVTKGEVFLAFIEKTKLLPEKIVFVDDRMENLKSLEDAIAKLDRPIEYHGLHYIGAEKYPSKMISEEEFAASWKKLSGIACELN